MAEESRTTGVTLCESCRTSQASLFCRADFAFLCITCDGKIHAANKLASRHARVRICDVCEQAPASVTCKADAAALCVTCDHDIHSANPLARRHQRFPVVPFYGPAATVSKIGGGGDDDDHHYQSDFDVNVAGTEAEEAEAASWLLPNPNPNVNKIADGSEDDHNIKVVEMKAEYLFNKVDPYLDIDLKTPNQKANQILHRYHSPTDGVVPVQNKNNNHHYQIPPHAHASSDVVEGLPAYEIDYTGSKPFMYNFTSQSIGQSGTGSSSSLEIEVGEVPDDNAAMADVSNNHHQSSAEVHPSPVSGLDREASVLRYKEKRKNRKFEKTIRYASRKAYAETRPRIKGRFVKRTEIDVEADHDAFISPDYSSYGVVPSY